MSERALVSIVTPSYNLGTFIEETILSVKDQAWSNVEHIIMDGGSTDCTLDILRRYEGTYNMRWNSEPDGGMYQVGPYGTRRRNRPHRNPGRRNLDAVDHSATDFGTTGSHALLIELK